MYLIVEGGGERVEDLGEVDSESRTEQSGAERSGAERREARVSDGWRERRGGDARVGHSRGQRGGREPIRNVPGIEMKTRPSKHP